MCLMLAGAVNAENVKNPKEAEAAGCSWSVIVVDKEGNEIDSAKHNGNDNEVDCLMGALSQVKEFQGKYPGMSVSYKVGGVS